MEEDKNPQGKPSKVIQKMNDLVREARRRVELKRAKENLEQVLERVKKKT
jgi:hypothetical protein